MEQDNKRGFRDAICWFATRNRIPILIIAVIFSLGLATQAVKIKGQVNLRDLLPYDHPYVKLHEKFSQVFGSGISGVVIALKAEHGDIFNQKFLTKLQKMTAEVEMWDEVYRVLTVSIASRSAKVVKTLGQGVIRIDPLMWPKIPENDAEMATLKRYIFSSPAYNGTFVSRDGTAALLITQFREEALPKAFPLLRDLTKRYQDADISVHVIGFPMMMGWIYSYQFQMIIVFALTFALMIWTLHLAFHNLVGMVAPIANALICLGVSLGFTGLSGINFSPLSYVLAFLIVARMHSNAVQITHRYIEEYKASGGTKDRAVFATMRSMVGPNWMATATEVAGFLVLMGIGIALMQQIAIIMGFWMFTILTEGILVPILCSVVPLSLEKEVEKKTRSRNWLGKIDLSLTRFSMGRGRYAVATIVVAILALGTWKTMHLKVGDPTSGTPILWPDHVYNVDQGMIDRTFDASSENFTLFYEGEKESVYDPVVLTTFESFSRHMEQQLPDIYKSSSSMIDLVENVNVTLHDGDKLWYQLPQETTMLTGFMGFIRDRVDPASLSRFVDKTLERAQITLYFSDHTTDNLKRIHDATYGFFSENNPKKTELGQFLLAGGRIGVEMALNDEIKSTHFKIDALVLFCILILSSTFFRSIVAGLMLTLPLILANLVAFGYMAVMNIGLTVNTLPVAAIGAGVGVDFAIYIYSRIIEEFPKHKNFNDTVINAIGTAGEAVVLTGLTLILPVLSWYFICGLKFQAQMGFFLSMLLTINMLSALTLHPLLIAIIKPKFMMRRLHEAENQKLASANAR